MIDVTNDTHDPTLRSWVESANTPDTDFPIQNLPFGVFRRRGGPRGATRIGAAIGNEILDLARLDELGLIDRLSDRLRAAVHAPSLNALADVAPTDLSALRRCLIDILRADTSRPDPPPLVAMTDAELVLPIDAGDYTDFYASIFHATRVGQLFRPDAPLQPNYKHVPIAYHGRASSLVVSGTEVVRPSGQIKRDAGPAFCPTEKLDYEAEVGFIVGVGNALGYPIAIDEAEAHLFGVCLVNDWSARDIQMWESQPLGPFLAKSFATTLSPWIVTLEALAPFRCPAFVRPAGDPTPLPYLHSERNERLGGIDLTVDVSLRSLRMREAGAEPVRISRGSLRNMYWTAAQMLAHQTSNGCNLRPGDLLASGTVSGSTPGSEGCLLEFTAGAHPIELPTGELRTFLADGDEVVIRGFCERAGFARIGFGRCAGTVRGASSASGTHRYAGVPA